MHRARVSKPGSDGGFTLIELLVVVIIIGVLAGIAMLAVSAFQKDAVGAACPAGRRTLESAIAAYQGQHLGAYPPSLDVLEAAPSRYIEGSHITGNQYNGKGFTLVYTPATGELNACP